MPKHLGIMARPWTLEQHEQFAARQKGYYQQYGYYYKPPEAHALSDKDFHKSIAVYMLQFTQGRKKHEQHEAHQALQDAQQNTYGYTDSCSTEDRDAAWKASGERIDSKKRK